eukprot:GHVN01078932.1.p1 GENE.GHVN01078932.1~~GHVN01078932.1.p1  ORF type:complete len:107 (+),score=4.74 GHVN01078932.1:646-966(+)
MIHLERCVFVFCFVPPSSTTISFVPSSSHSPQQQPQSPAAAPTSPAAATVPSSSSNVPSSSHSATPYTIVRHRQRHDYYGANGNGEMPPCVFSVQCCNGALCTMCW